MRQLIWRELLVAAQYLGLVLVALVVAFFAEIMPSDPATHININVAWKNFEPYVRRVVLVFAALSLARAALVFAARYLLQRSK